MVGVASHSRAKPERGGPPSPAAGRLGRRRACPRRRLRVKADGHGQAKGQAAGHRPQVKRSGTSGSPSWPRAGWEA
jgi:hypothetical protein